MLGYATNETDNFMPLSHDLSNKLCRRLHDCRTDGTLPWLRPDGKSQVTIEYEQVGSKITPTRVHTVLISTQHDDKVSTEDITKGLMEHVVKFIIPEKLLDEKTIYHMNPSGSFITGGPKADAGLTGRKIIVDTYGGWGGHGGTSNRCC